MLRLAFAAAALLAPSAAWAHQAGDAGLRSAGNEVCVALLLATSLGLYALGLSRLWKRAGAGRGITRGQALRFALGWLALYVALLSPVDAGGDTLFCVHMVQHELLMVVAAPLLVLGRPLEAWAWGLPPAWRPRLARVARVRGLARAWNAITEPVGAWCVHFVALWAWHVPRFFEAALESESVHVLQHASFLASALLFWWAVFGRGVKRPDGASMAMLFTTMMHTSALGALLTFAPTPWYSHYVGTVLLSPVEDQQLGGLVMWVPGGVSYLVAGLSIVAAWLRRGPARTVLS
ncbi:MAG TPA: cytochrome c oxidase assembly protein [Usitatibacter sp.]|nr:cytochrome c oxidase assembly protein [Usitatibacter sp.]